VTAAADDSAAATDLDAPAPHDDPAAPEPEQIAVGDGGSSGAAGRSPLGAGRDLPQRTLTRSARLMTLPLGVAGRAAVGLGKRVGGAPAEAVAAEMQARAAEQMFRVLGELKGGAMKIGQALSVLEAAMPEELAGPYRQALTRLQDAAPALPADRVHAVLARELGEDWRERFRELDDEPAAAASIGQVHRGVARDGREVAVKVQYPGADRALLSDLEQAIRMARVFGTLVPGMDIKPLLAEVRARTAEELDYLREADAQRQFAAAYDSDPDFVVPHVLAASPHVLISEWVDGTPLSAVIADGTAEQRNLAGLRYQRFLLSGPTRAGLLHADPHPGNFRITADGRLCVLDYGAVARLPDGFPPAVGRLLAIAMRDDAEAVLAGLREEGFVKPGVSVDPVSLLAYLSPFIDPARTDEFTYSREWLREQFSRINDPRNPDFVVGMKLNLPPTYLLIHRVWLGSVGVLCQLGACVDSRGEISRWVPAFTADVVPAGGVVSPGH